MTAQQHNSFAARNKSVTIMNTKYTIKNFRVFDEKGVTIDIKPITILTGCNNSGKSSIVKSMVLLDTIVSGIHTDYIDGKKIHIGKYKLDFSTKKTSSLGNYKRIIHAGSDSESIEFQYRVFSRLLDENILVKLTLSTDEYSLNNLKEGYIAKIDICKENGEELFSMQDFNYEAKRHSKRPKYSLKSLSDNFYRFVIGQFLVESYRNHEKCCEQYSYANEKGRPYYGMDKEELEQESQWLEEFEQAYRNKFGDNALRNIISWFNDFTGYSFKEKFGYSTFIGNYLNGDFDVITKSRQFGTFFYSATYEKLYNVPKESFRDVIMSLVQGKTLDIKLEIALEKIISDFEDSEYDSFANYFESKESELLSIRRMLIGDEYWGRSAWKDTRFITNPLNGFLFSEDFVLEDENDIPEEIGFGLIYAVIMNLDSYYNIDGTKYYRISLKDNEDSPVYSHPIFEMFLEYANYVVEDAICKLLPHDLSYVSTSVVNVKRIYPLDADDYFTLMLKQYIDAKKLHDRLPCDFDHFYPGDFINHWVRKLNIGYSIMIPEDEEGLGTTVRLYKDKDDKKGTILAEQGYGISQLFVILMRIETAIMRPFTNFERVYEEDLYLGDNRNNHNFKQVPADYTIAIEEPEVHLHPKLQSMLAEILVDAYTKHNIHFIIETHSEYIVRKLQLLVANKEMKNSDISLLYVYDEKDRPGYEPQVKKIGIHKDGMLNGNFGEGFFDEADMLSMYLLTAGGNGDE